MDAGKFDRRITIQRATTADNSMGEPIETWSDAGQRIGALLSFKEREAFSNQGQRELAVRVIRFRFRYFPGLKETDRIFEVEAGFIWDIIGIKEIGRRHFHEVTVERKI